MNILVTAISRRGFRHGWTDMGDMGDGGLQEHAYDLQSGGKLIPCHDPICIESILSVGVFQAASYSASPHGRSGHM